MGEVSNVFDGIMKEVRGNILPIGKMKDDVFFVCSSFEERTANVSSMLGTNYRTKRSFIFRYDEQTLTDLRDTNLETLKQILTKHSDITTQVDCDRYNPVEGIYKLQDHCKEHSIQLREANITIDMTTFTKQCLLILLNFIEKQKPKSVRLFYTEPEDYAPRWGKPLTYGLIDITSVPSYGGHHYQEKETFLILFVGYEGNRAYTIWEKLTPHKTLVLIGKPSFKDPWEGRVEELNKKLLSKLSPDSIANVATLNPFEVAKTLSSVIKEYSTGFNIIISPLGPKPQVLGCYLAARKYPDVQIVYAIPKRYEEEYFSRRVGKVWEYS